MTICLRCDTFRLVLSESALSLDGGRLFASQFDKSNRGALSRTGKVIAEAFGKSIIKNAPTLKMEPDMKAREWLIVLIITLASVSAYAQFSWDSTRIGQGITLGGVAMRSKSTGIVVGDSGVIARTTDGGATWARLNSGTSVSLSVIAIVDSLSICVGGSNVIRYSTDGGTSWSAGTIPVPASMRSMAFDKYGHGIIAGAGGAIFKSTDRGKSWTASTSVTTNSLFKACFLDSAIAIAVGSQLTIIRSTDAGSNWSVVQAKSGTLRDVSSPSPGCAVADGFYGSQALLQRTTDGGLHWDSLIVSGITSFVLTSFYSADTGFALGSHGAIYRTVSGGKTWDSVSAAPFLASAFGMSFTSSSTGILLDPFGMIYYAVSPLTGIRGERLVTGSFNLSQNYPNPFNPSTTIRYGLPGRAHVTLSMFNTLGQQVGTLVNETQEAGYHDVLFNGAGLASGVYVYRLQAGDFVQTKKLLILR